MVDYINFGNGFHKYENVFMKESGNRIHFIVKKYKKNMHKNIDNILFASLFSDFTFSNPFCIIHYAPIMPYTNDSKDFTTGLNKVIEYIYDQIGNSKLLHNKIVKREISSEDLKKDKVCSKYFEEICSFIRELNNCVNCDKMFLDSKNGCTNSEIFCDNCLKG